MTIKNIRRLQLSCLGLLVLAGLLLPYSLLLARVGSPAFSDFFAAMAALSLVAGCLLLLVIRKLRCPVCRSIFVGRRSPRYFTRACCNCGRRPGDTA